MQDTYTWKHCLLWRQHFIAPVMFSPHTSHSNLQYATVGLHAHTLALQSCLSSDLFCWLASVHARVSEMGVCATFEKLKYSFPVQVKRKILSSAHMHSHTCCSHTFFTRGFPFIQPAALFVLLFRCTPTITKKSVCICRMHRPPARVFACSIPPCSPSPPPAVCVCVCAEKWIAPSYSQTHQPAAAVYMHACS